MSRVEQIGDAILYLGDCREIIPALTRPAAIISDPPYGIGYVRGEARTGLHRGPGANKHAGIAINGDQEPFDPRPLLDICDNVLIWGADHFYPRLPDSGRFLVWNKLGGLKSWDSFSDVEFAWHSCEGAARIFDWMWKGLVADRQGENNGFREHPTQKPIALMAWCIDQAKVTPGGIVLDPYMGSGSTGVACAKLGYQFIGIDSDERWFDVACRRLEMAHKEPQLFQPSAQEPAVQLALMETE